MSTIFDRRHYGNRSDQDQDRNLRNQPYSGPGSQWGSADKNGFAWYSTTAGQWGGAHGIDQNTGAITANDGGPVGSVPWQVAQQWQSAHDQAVYNVRNRLMQSAAKYGQGNLRLMQSFRPGGGATIEANSYGNMANIQLNRAAMTQPLDYMGDYRDHYSKEAASNARKAQQQQQLIGAGVAVASVVAGALTGGVGGALIGGLAGAGGLLGNKGGQGGQSGYDVYQDPNLNGGYLSGGKYQNPGVAGDFPGAGGSNGAPTAGAPDGRGAGGTDLSGPSAGGRGPLAAGMQQEPGRAMPQGGQGGKPQQGGAGGQQVAGGGGGGPMGGGQPFADGPFAGADGNFTSTAYAAAGAQRLNPVTQTMLLRQVADRASADPFYDSFAMTVDIEMARRMPQAAGAA